MPEIAVGRLLDALARVHLDLHDGVREIGASLRSSGRPPEGSHLCADAVVIDPAEDRVLLIRHRVAGWMFPGGHVDPGEEPPATAVRELREETGLESEGPMGDPLALYRMEVPARHGEPRHRHWTLAYSAVLPPSQIGGVPIGSNEGEVRWHPLSSLPKGTNDVVPVVVRAARHRGEVR